MNFDLNFKSGYQILKELRSVGTINFPITILSDTNIFTFPFKISNNIEDSYVYIEKIVASLLWIVGGYQIIFNCNKDQFEYLKSKLEASEELKESIYLLQIIYQRKIEFINDSRVYENKTDTIQIGSDFSGNRIGLDAGGSDIKITSIKNGKIIHSEEILWLPKSQDDYSYHITYFENAIKKAASYLDSVDAIGISTAGVVSNNKLLQAALFIKVSNNFNLEEVRSIFSNVIEKNYPNTPYCVFNDGDVTAIAGAQVYNVKHVLGIAMGTSEASGYCKDKNSIYNYISELGKAPLDYSINATKHHSTKLSGAGSGYLSQSGVIRLAKMAGIEYEGTLAYQLKMIQKEVDLGNSNAIKVFEDMGYYLASAIAMYYLFFKIENVLVLGRVVSGKSGDILVESTRKYIKEVYSEIGPINIIVPDDNFRRLGQAYYAASLPNITK